MLTYIDDDMLRLYINSLPTSVSVEKYRESLLDCETWSQLDLNSFCGRCVPVHTTLISLNSRQICTK